MGDLLEALQWCLDRGLTFAAFRSGQAVELWVQDEPQLTALRPEALDKEQDVFLVVPFQDPDGAVFTLRPDHRYEFGEGAIDLDRLLSAVTVSVEDRPPIAEWDEKGHAEAVNEALSAIRSGPLTKVVLSRCLRVPFPRARLSDLFRAGLEQYPEAFVCLLNCPEFGTWLGASPERLLCVEKGYAEIDSIAGTMPRGIAPVSPELWGGKERNEQEQVTQGIVEALRSMGAGSISLSGTTVMNAGSIAHLHTRVRSVLGNLSVGKLLDRLHPTAAVCGRPTLDALRFIQDHEACSRGLYAGSWGPWQVDGTTSLHVNIRCAEWRGNDAYLHVGGGITVGSDPRLEWQETEHKARTWSDLMSAAPQRIS